MTPLCAVLFDRDGTPVADASCTADPASVRLPPPDCPGAAPTRPRTAGPGTNAGSRSAAGRPRFTRTAVCRPNRPKRDTPGPSRCARRGAQAQ
ncbi:hypothetical protein GCM10010260_46380 [Streptomyces filipinensis]|uniref:Uncharacterized protein n=1 Tax=Streptomyces filipinensis TaxID=66887 RepID=A0A918IE72_9ACTN|nr:hypothetical protein GCM10010260_46380 [Streptomyces filipinensis]